MYTQDEVKQRKHLQLWIVAIFPALFLVALFAGLFASFEHDSWFPQDIARMINSNEEIAYPAVMFVGWLVSAGLFYALGLFTKSSAGASYSASSASTASTAYGSSSYASATDDSATPSSDVAAAEPSSASAFSSSGGSEQPIFGKMQISTRVYWGDFFLQDDALYFVNLKDQSAMKANAGEAVARQFGLIGMAIRALMTMGAKKKFQAELDAARHQVNAYPLEERVGKSPSSFRLEAGKIEKANKSFFGGNWFQSEGIKYVLQEFDKPTLEQFGAWFISHGVPQKGFDK